VQGAAQRFPEVDEATQKQAAASAKAVAYRAGVGRVRIDELRTWLAETTRTTYFLDVRTPEEFAAGHVMGSRSAPGGQLVQETDHTAPVRGARIVLCDNEGVRANMSASWLAQMGWDVYVLEGLQAQDFAHTDTATPAIPEPQGSLTKVTPAQVKAWLADRNSHTVVLDFSTSAQFVKGHIQNAWWVLRSELKQSLIAAHKGHRYVDLPQRKRLTLCSSRCQSLVQSRCRSALARRRKHCLGGYWQHFANRRSANGSGTRGPLSPSL